MGITKGGPLHLIQGHVLIRYKNCGKKLVSNDYMHTCTAVYESVFWLLMRLAEKLLIFVVSNLYNLISWCGIRGIYCCCAGLRYIGSVCSYIEEATNLSAETHRKFMKHRFAVWGQSRGPTLISKAILRRFGYFSCCIRWIIF